MKPTHAILILLPLLLVILGCLFGMSMELSNFNEKEEQRHAQTIGKLNDMKDSMEQCAEAYGCLTNLSDAILGVGK